MDEKMILLIEDEPTINRLLSKYFEKAQYKVMSALNGKDGLELFYKEKFDLVVLDIMMPYVNGWQVAKEIRRTSHVPIMMMSALSQEEDILRGYSLEVDDYITKPFAPLVLVAKIQSLFKRIELEHEHHFDEVININGINFEFSTFQSSQSIEEILTLDELTQISNRRFLDFFLKEKLKNAEEFNQIFSLLFIDIDHFKQVNDTYGHDIGDVVIKELAQLVKYSLRSNDLIARFGGEEFVVVLDVSDEITLQSIAEKLRSVIEKNIFDKDNNKLHITASIGGTIYQKNDTIDSVLKRADSNMYISKKTGRNKTTID